jgi:hypothetical protein
VEEQILNRKGTSKKASYPDRAILFITRYRIPFIPFAFLSMAWFHVPLFLNRKINFYKLMGTGKNGTFDIRPDFGQWTLMAFYNERDFPGEITGQDPTLILGKFIPYWWSLFCSSVHHVVLEPVAGHGTWDGKQFLESNNKQTSFNGKIAVLTRATIRLSRLRQFWSAVPAAAKDLTGCPGFCYSIGIGEIPFVKQATFSIWSSIEEMKEYAYGRKEHQEVIRRTRKEDWYSEEMFLRFRVLESDLPSTTPFSNKTKTTET